VRPVYAVRAGQRGDLTLPGGQTQSAAIAWSHPRGGTYIPTPLHYRGHLYTVNNNGILTCYRADTGAQVYQTRLGAVGRVLRGLAGRGRRSPLLRQRDRRGLTCSARGPRVRAAGHERHGRGRDGDARPVDGLMVVRTTGNVVGLAVPEKTADPLTWQCAGSDSHTSSRRSANALTARRTRL
jgi:hypothetical protein